MKFLEMVFGKIFNMKLIGFIKEHNNLPEALPLKDVLGSTPNDLTIISSVIKYLNEGILVLSWMGYFMDLDNKTPVAPDSYFTDGEYVWPAYFSYYLEKYSNYKIDQEFLNHISNNHFVVDKANISSSDVTKWERNLSDKLNGNT